MERRALALLRPRRSWANACNGDVRVRLAWLIRTAHPHVTLVCALICLLPRLDSPVVHLCHVCVCVSVCVCVCVCVCVRARAHVCVSGVYMISAQIRVHAWHLISTRGADKTPTSGFIGAHPTSTLHAVLCACIISLLPCAAAAGAAVRHGGARRCAAVHGGARRGAATWRKDG